MVTIKELHEKALPESKKKYVKMDVVSYYIWRPICDILAILFLNTKIKATTITILSFYSCLISLLLFIFVPGIKGALLGYFFYWLWNIADGVDGLIARYTNTCTKSGDLWDALAGYVAMFVFYFGAGIVAAKEDSQIVLDVIPTYAYVIMGTIAAVCTMLPRLTTQKKESVYGKEASSALKDRTTFGFAKIVALNMVSINGLAGALFLVAILLRMTNLFVCLYLFVMLAFGAFSLYAVMRKLPE